MIVVIDNIAFVFSEFACVFISSFNFCFPC